MGDSVVPSVCIERRIVGIVGRVASSQSCGVFVGGKSGKRLGLAPGVSAPKRKVSPFCSRRLTPRSFCHGILFRLFTVLHAIYSTGEPLMAFLSN